MDVQTKSRSVTRRRRGRTGFTLAEVALSLVVFGMMTMMFAAVFPMAVRGAQHGNTYSQAAAIAQRKIDQLRSAGYSRLDSTDLTALGVVNGQNANGTYDFTTQDNLTGTGGFFTAPAAGGVGTVAVSDYASDVTTQDPNAAGSLPGTGNAAMVTVTLSWGGVDKGSYSASALIVSMAHK